MKQAKPDAFLLPARFWAAVKASVREWLGQGVFHWGAALAFYSLLSLTPLVLLGLTGMGTLLHGEAARARSVELAGRWLGESAQQVVSQVVDTVSTLSFDSPIIIPTVVMLLLGATAIFTNVQAALNDIWRIRPQAGAVKNLLRSRAAAVVMVFALGGAVGLSVVLSTFSQVILPYVPGSIAASVKLGQLAEAGITLLVLWALLCLTFAVLPDADIAWRDVAVGAGFTAALLSLGKVGLGIYVGFADLGSAFGAAGSVFTLLVWLYYSAQIFFLGAVFTRVWSDMHGASVRPEAHASFVETRPTFGTANPGDEGVSREAEGTGS